MPSGATSRSLDPGCRAVAPEREPRNRQRSRVPLKGPRVPPVLSETGGPARVVHPVMDGGSVRGIVTREDLETALRERRVPDVREIGTCYSDQTVKEVGSTFVESAVPVLLVLERGTNVIQGIVTLHDLIRAQAAIQT